MAGRAVQGPRAAAGAHVAALGGQQHLVAHAQLVEQARDEPLVGALGVGAQLVTGPVGVGGVEERHARVESRPHRVEQLLARLRPGLVEGHQAQPDGADLDAPDGVVADLSCLHAPCLPAPGDRPRSPLGVSNGPTTAGAVEAPNDAGPDGPTPRRTS